MTSAAHKIERATIRRAIEPRRPRPKKATKPVSATNRKHFPTAATRNRVMRMRADCATVLQIGDELHVSRSMVERHYPDELAEGNRCRDDTVECELFRMAKSGKVVAANIYWTKSRMGWTEAVPDTPPPIDPTVPLPSLIIMPQAAPKRDDTGMPIGGWPSDEP
jgi:hypothetical protein